MRENASLPSMPDIRIANGKTERIVFSTGIPFACTEYLLEMCH